MSVSRDFEYATYVDDQALAWNVRIDKTFKDNEDAGFTAPVQGQPRLASRYMRYVLGLNTATGQRAKHPCGTDSCDLWTGAATTFTRPAIGSETPTTFQRTKKRGETIDTAIDTFNV